MAEKPDFAAGRVERAKVVDYLLGSSTVASRAKARFFLSLGFSADRWEALAGALRAQARDGVVTAMAGPWGTKHVATGEIDAPNGRRYKIVSVWIAEESTVRLVTAYPSEETGE
jgi:hypothetical protein